MMRFNVGGQYLETADSNSLQLTKKNSIFAFDELECDRSTSFDLPLSQKNIEILGFDYDPHTIGTKMRTKIAAQMQDGVVVYNGYIYFGSYDKDKNVCECIFVFGNMLALQAISQEGKIATYYTPSNAVYWNGSWTGSALGSTLWNTYVYAGHNLDITKSKPSVALFELAQKVAATRGVTVSTTVEMAKHLRYVKKELVDGNGQALEFGDYAQLRYNLPDLTLSELLKIVAYSSGCAIIVDGSTITLDRIGDSATWNVLYMDSVAIDEGVYNRGMADFAQSSRVIGKWTSFPKSDTSERTLVGYYISNVNIEESKDLFEMPFVIPLEGARVESTYYALMDDNEEAVDWMGLQSYTASDKLLLVIQDNTPQSYGMAKNGLIENLCDKSTKCEASFKMSLYEFEQLSPKTIIYYNGLRWMWVECEWSKNVCKLILQKV